MGSPANLTRKMQESLETQKALEIASETMHRLCNQRDELARGITVLQRHNNELAGDVN